MWYFLELQTTVKTEASASADMSHTHSGYSLICFNQLVERQQAAVPAAGVLRLQVHAYLVHNGGPAAREVMLDDDSQTDRQLSPGRKFRCFTW